MKKIKVAEPVQKKSLFGTKTVLKEKTIKVDNKTYKAIKKEEQKRKDKEFDDIALWVETIWDD